MRNTIQYVNVFKVIRCSKEENQTMEENKEIMEQAALTPEEKTEQVGIAESEKLPAEPADMPEKLKKKI